MDFWVMSISRLASSILIRVTYRPTVSPVSSTNSFWCFDHFGSYVPVILCYCGIMAAVTLAFQIVLTVAHRDRQKYLA